MGPSAAAARKSSMYCALKPMESGSPLYSFSMRFLGFAVFRAGRGNFDAFLGDGKFYGVRARVGKLRDALHGVVQFAALDHHVLVVVARQDGFVVGELPGEHARNQQAFAGAEE